MNSKKDQNTQKSVFKRFIIGVSKRVEIHQHCQIDD